MKVPPHVVSNPWLPLGCLLGIILAYQVAARWLAALLREEGIDILPSAMTAKSIIDDIRCLVFILSRQYHSSPRLATRVWGDITLVLLVTGFSLFIYVWFSLAPSPFDIASSEY